MMHGLEIVLPLAMFPNRTRIAAALMSTATAKARPHHRIAPGPLSELRDVHSVLVCVTCPRCNLKYRGFHRHALESLDVKCAVDGIGKTIAKNHLKIVSYEFLFLCSICV